MTPYFRNSFVTLYHGDAREVLSSISGVTAVVTDPPYELGFMGKKWDNTGIAFDPEFWNMALFGCLPGAHLLAFGGSRTFHRIACAIEDAGWEIRDAIFWCFGSGFPKSLDVGKQLPEWRGYGTNLKPAYENITLARKPLCGTVVQNVTENGCGALNIDGCRVETCEKLRDDPIRYKGGSWYNGSGDIVPRYNSEGRWPANIIHDGSKEVVSGFPETQSGGSVASLGSGSGEKLSVFGNGSLNTSGFHDSGSAARFFYCAKASGNEREDNSHATVKPMALMEYLCRLIKQPSRNLVLDPFTGSGTTLLACELLGIPCIGIELEESSCEIIAKRFSKPASPFLL